MKKGKIIIRLKSALVAGSGYSYAGIIDSDICYDEYGLPFIPARRIKGCLREVVEKQLGAIINENTIAEIFGIRGNDGNIGLSVSNAYLQDYESITAQIDKLKSENSHLSTLLDKQSVLEKFTSVKTQTKMENGVADDNSLRYTRTINSHSPVTGEEMEFIAEVTYEERHEEDLRKIARGLRNIGVMRNRGLGSVDCRLEPCDSEASLDIKWEAVESDTVEICYVFTNTAPLVISASRDDSSINYIPGQNVLGLLAARYLAAENASPDDKMFKDLFLNGKTVFTNATPFYDGLNYYPAPANINILKKTKQLVDTECASGDQKKDNTVDGNLPKKLKGKFIAQQVVNRNTTGFRAGDIAYGVHEVDMKVVYHHSHRSTGRNAGGLYTQIVISEGQQFAGKIVLPAEYAESAVQMLTSSDLYFGKSKTAQYGKCRLDEIIVKDHSPAQLCLKAGETIIVTLQSDAIFSNETGYTVGHDEVVRQICKSLGINSYSVNKTDDKAYSIVQTKIAHGYQTKWNLRKQPIPAIEAGSVYAIRIDQDVDISIGFVGERNIEGYGQIAVNTWKGDAFFLKTLGDYRKSFYKEGKTVESVARDTDCSDVILTDEFRNLAGEIVLESIKDKAKRKKIAVRNADADYEAAMKINASLRGRVTLMLAESIANYPDKDNWEDRCKDFGKRIVSIKGDGRTKVINALREELLFIEESEREEGNKYEVLTDELCPDEASPEKRILADVLGFSDKEILNMINATWSDVLMAILVNDKYMKGE